MLRSAADSTAIEDDDGDEDDVAVDADGGAVDEHTDGEVEDVVDTDDVAIYTP